jgi:FKBP-type peptidyl-prolyl cis-trans isomerase
MQKPAIVTVLALASVPLLYGLASQAAPSPQTRPALKDERSYSIGYDLGRQTAARLVMDGVSYDKRDLLAGIADALQERPPAMGEDRMQDMLAELEREVRERDVQRQLASDPVFKALHDENLRRSREFHARFGREADVETLPSGVQRRVVIKGTGQPVKKDSVVVATFRASLLDGFVFGEGKRQELRVAGLLPGAQRLVTQMRAGDHWYVAMPPAAAFGAAGRPPDVGPNETVLLDVEIHEVRSATP